MAVPCTPQADQDTQEFVAVADLAMLIGVAWALRIRAYAEKHVGSWNGTDARNACSSAGTAVPMLSWSLAGLGDLVLVVFGDGQGERGGVDLQSEPVGRLDGVAVELHRLGAVATELHRVGPEGVHPGAGLAAADQEGAGSEP
jgi:hypothetical protein